MEGAKLNSENNINTEIKPFNTAVSCSLYKNIYTLLYSRGTTETLANSSGIYDELLERFLDRVDDSSKESVKEAFSKDALISFFENGNTFMQLFFLYNLDGKIKGRASLIAYRMAESNSNDMNCLIFLRSIGYVGEEGEEAEHKRNIYNSLYKLDKIRAAVGFNTSKDDYFILGGEIKDTKNNVINRSGKFNYLIEVISSYFKTYDDKKAFLSFFDIDSLMEVFKMHGDYFVKLFLLDVDGEQRWHEFIFMYMDDQMGKLVLIIKDVHDRLQQETYMAATGTLSKKEDIMYDDIENAAYDNLPYAFCEIELKPGIPLRAGNTMFYKLIGYTKDEFKESFNNRLLYICHPLDIPFLEYTYEQSLSTGQSTVNVETRILRKGGELHWVNISVTHAKNTDGMLGYMVIKDITEEKLYSNKSMIDLKEMQSEMEKTYRVFFDYDFKTRTVSDRAGLSSVAGMPEEIADIDKWMRENDAINEGDLGAIKNIIEGIYAGETSITKEIRVKKPDSDSEYINYKVSLSVVHDADEKPMRAIGILEKLEDGRDGMDILAKYRNSSSRNKSSVTEYVLNLSKNAIESYKPLHPNDKDIFDGTGKPIHIVARYLANNFIKEEARSQFIEKFNTENLFKEFYDGNRDLSFIAPAEHPLFGDLWLKCMIHIMRDELSYDIKAIIYVLDVSDEYRTISDLEKESGRDALTGLYNRKYTHKQISDILEKMVTENGNAALAIVDLDDFKILNDTYGHQNGDEYLVEIADALKLWKTDKDIVVRIGGDEFGIFMAGYGSKAEIREHVKALDATIKQVGKMHIPMLTSSASIGVAFVCKNCKTLNDLYDMADTAMYHVKKTKKGGYAYYEDVRAIKKTPFAVIGSFYNKNKKVIARDTKIGVLVLLILLLLLGIAALFRDEIDEYSETHLSEYNENNLKYIQLYMDDMYKENLVIGNYFNSTYGWLLDDQNFCRLGKTQVDLYLPSEPFDHVYLVSKNGKCLYPSNAQSTSVPDILLRNLDSDKWIYEMTVPYYINDDKITMSFIMQLKNNVYMVCMLKEETLNAFIEEYHSYPGGDTYLISEDNYIIGSVVQNKFATWGEVYSRDDMHIIESKATMGGSDFSAVWDYEKAGNTFCISVKSFDLNITGMPRKHSVMMIVPQFSLISQTLTSLNSLIFATIFAIIALFACSIFFTTRYSKSLKKLKEQFYGDNETDLHNIKYLEEIFKDPGLNLPNHIAFVDLEIDGFKQIIEVYGAQQAKDIMHTIGSVISEDLKYKEVGIRVFDAKYCLILECTDKMEFTDRMKNLRNNIYAACIQRLSNPINLNASIGVFIYGSSIDNRINPFVAYNFADAARTKEKKSKSGLIGFYRTDILRDAQKKKKLEEDINYAFENNQFVPYFQPVVSNITGRVVSTEALVRWIKDDGTIISPGVFIPVLEGNGELWKLDYYIYEKCCEKLQQWRNTELSDLKVSVNMSKQNFYQIDFVQTLVRIAKQYGVKPEQIQIEITESVYIDNVDLINEVLLKLKSFGFLISMDDFGTGYSSMGMLHTVPIDILKIDKSFVDVGFTGYRSNVILEGIVAIAKGLDLKIICEGVETKEQNDGLKELSCEFIQGYYYSKPLSAEEFEKYAKETHLP